MWQRGGRRRGRGRNQGQWPGNGPFSHLPPWERPGWLYGPGSCWTLYQQGATDPSNSTPPTPPRSIPTENYCHKCSAPLVPFAKYCSQCGAKIKK